MQLNNDECSRRKDKRKRERVTNGPGKEISPWKLIPEREALRAKVNRRLVRPGTQVCWGEGWKMTAAVFSGSPLVLVIHLSS